MTAPRRYPLQPLLDVLRCDEVTVKARLGIDGRQVARYQAEGLPERRADELACKGGLHPYLVWPAMADDHVADAEREALAEREKEEARLARRRKRQAAARRKRYHTDPEYRAQKLAYGRAYRARQTAQAQLRRGWRTCAKYGCSVSFPVAKGHQRYCSDRCRNTEKMRRYRNARYERQAVERQAIAA